MNRKALRDLRDDVVFIGPGFVVFAIIVLASFVMGIYYSFTEWNGVNKEAVWIGLQNYRDIFRGDEQAGIAAMFTLKFTIVTLILSNLLAFALALLLTMKLKLVSILRTVFVLPNVIGGIILGFIWRFIFITGFGALGEITGWSVFNLPWLGTPETGFWASVIVFIWQRTGYLMVIYIAAIVNINTELLEAARIDGASWSQTLTRIIVPLVMPAFTVCLFLVLSWTTKMFECDIFAHRRGPFGSTETFAINIYYEAFTYNNYGMASAKAVLFFLVVGVISTLQVLITKRLEVEA